MPSRGHDVVGVPDGDDVPGWKFPEEAVGVVRRPGGLHGPEDRFFEAEHPEPGDVFARQVIPAHMVTDSSFAQTVLAAHRALAQELHYLVVGHPGDLAGDLVRAVGVWGLGDPITDEGGG